MDLIAMAMSQPRKVKNEGNAIVYLTTPIPFMSDFVTLSQEDSVALDSLPVNSVTIFCYIVDFGAFATVYGCVTDGSESFFTGNLVVGTEILSVILARTSESFTRDGKEYHYWSGECMGAALTSIEQENTET